MGILQSGLLGPFRKKVGPVIGRRQRSQAIMTSLYRKKTKSYTEKQIEIQLKFGLLSNFLSDISSLVDIGFKRYSKVKTPRNTAYSYNYPHAFIKTPDGLSLNYPKLIYSRGHIAPPVGIKIITEGTKLIISWLPQPQSAYCQHTDMANFLIYNPKKNKAVTLINMADRFTLGGSIEVCQSFIGEVLHCYISFTSANGKLAGNSVYIGEVSPQ